MWNKTPILLVGSEGGATNIGEYRTLSVTGAMRGRRGAGREGGRGAHWETEIETGTIKRMWRKPGCRGQSTKGKDNREEKEYPSLKEEDCVQK